MAIIHAPRTRASIGSFPGSLEEANPAEKDLEARLSTYQGLLTLDHPAVDASLPPSQRRLRAMPAILRRDDERGAVLRREVSRHSGGS